MPKVPRRNGGDSVSTDGGRVSRLQLAQPVAGARGATEKERLAHIQFIESLDRVNSAVHGTEDLEQMLTDVLDCVLSMFDCDRAWLVFPCDPQAASWRCPMERTRPEYPGTFALGIARPVNAQIAGTWRILIAAGGPVKFGPGGDCPLPEGFQEHFQIQSFIAVVLYPKIGQPWLFGLHQCSRPRAWTAEEERLFKEIGRRLADGLTTLLTFRNLQQREAEARGLANAQARLNRALRLLGHCHQLLIHADDESALLNDVCRLVVETGQYLMAWISVPEHDADQSVRVLAKYGLDQGYLDSINISWADNERGRGPTGTAIRTGEVQVCQDALNDPRFARWREDARKRGFRGSAALPLRDARGTFGALSIYAAEPDAFSPEEVGLMQELAGDLTFGIRALRTRAEHKAAEDKLAFLAHHDPLTQLPNRVLLRDASKNRSRVRSASESRRAAVLGRGQFQGDQRQPGPRRRRRAAGPGGAAAASLRARLRHGQPRRRRRVRGCADVHRRTDGGPVAQQILDAMERPFEIGGNSLHTSLSIGISVSPRTAATSTRCAVIRMRPCSPRKTAAATLTGSSTSR